MSHDAEHDKDEDARPDQIDDPPQKGETSYNAFVDTLFQPLRCTQAHRASAHVVDDIKRKHALLTIYRTRHHIARKPTGSGGRKHAEVYLCDMQKVAPAKNYSPLR